MTDATTFREHFPEFGASPGAGAYTDGRISFWLTLGAKLLNADRWGDLLDHGLELFVAHHLAIDAASLRAAGAGGSIGQVSGPTASKTVDKVSVSYDTGAITLESAGHWNLTTYGLQFWQMLRMVGAGPVHVY